MTTPARQTRGLERQLGNVSPCCNCVHKDIRYGGSWRQPVAQWSRRNAKTSVWPASTEGHISGTTP